MRVLRQAIVSNTNKEYDLTTLDGFEYLVKNFTAGAITVCEGASADYDEDKGIMIAAETAEIIKTRANKITLKGASAGNVEVRVWED